MKNNWTIFAFLIGILFVSCQSDQSNAENEKAETGVEELTKAESLLTEAIEAHGGELYEHASYRFTFREKKYSFTNNRNNYRYTVKSEQEAGEVFDVLDDGIFSRQINGIELQMTQEKKDKYAESLNSVIYFATLPHKLGDASVNKKYKGNVTIMGQQYDVLEVAFDKEGGGKDHDDQYCYWVNKQTKMIDYLAYNYQVNDGGVRFRSAYNKRTVGGIIFQDYVNYSAPVGTKLRDIPVLYERKALQEVSLIETEDVVNLKD